MDRRGKGWTGGSSPGPVVDALVIGGGLQGLLVAHELVGNGRSCALVSATDLGTGQTLHSHGVLNTGFGMMGQEPVQLLQRVVVPDLLRRGLEVYGEWGAIVPPGFSVGEPVGPPPGLNVRGFPFQRAPEVNVDRRALVEALASGVQDQVVRGEVSAVRRAADGQVEEVEVAMDSGAGSVTYRPGAVVVAAGTGTKAMLRRLGAAEEEIEPIKHRQVHVLCVRGPSDVLPVLNVVSMPDQLFVAAHRQGSTVTWYVTPMVFGGPHVEEVPGDASAEVDRGFVERGWATLRVLYPALDSLPGLHFTSYAGYRQDVGDMPGVPMCQRMAAAPNVISALPSGLLGAWPMATRAAALVGEIVGPRRPQPLVPGGGQSVRVGPPHEESAGLAWTDRLP